MIGNPSQRRDKMPRLIILALVLLALLAGAATPALAGSNGRKGTEGAPELMHRGRTSRRGPGRSGGG